MPLEFMLEMPFFSVLSPHLRPARSRLPQVCLSGISTLPQEELKKGSCSAQENSGSTSQFLKEQIEARGTTS